jgi:hypothetical protein
MGIPRDGCIVRGEWAGGYANSPAWSCDALPLGIDRSECGWRRSLIAMPNSIAVAASIHRFQEPIENLSIRNLQRKQGAILG